QIRLVLRHNAIRELRTNPFVPPITAAPSPAKNAPVSAVSPAAIPGSPAIAIQRSVRAVDIFKRKIGDAICKPRLRLRMFDVGVDLVVLLAEGEAGAESVHRYIDHAVGSRGRRFMRPISGHGYFHAPNINARIAHVRSRAAAHLNLWQFL